MSVVNRLGGKIVLSRLGPDTFWDAVREAYAGDDPLKWKYLAMLALRVNAGWSLDMIGNAFGHERGHVSRSLSNLRREMRERFDLAAEAEPEEESV